MKLLHNNEISNLKYEILFRVNKYDNNGDIVTYEHNKHSGDYLEILIYVNTNKILSIVFDLDGYFNNLELREKARKNAVTVMKRNYSGVFYLFYCNYQNLNNEEINYYLDYYNNNIVIDNFITRQLMGEVYQIIDYIKKKESNGTFKRILSKITNHSLDTLFQEDLYLSQGYMSQLSVLPPNVRPDNNSNYIIIQVTSGCSIMSRRKRACGFCAAYGMKYHEFTLTELEKHIDRLIVSRAESTKKATRVFLADGDPLSATNILQYIEIIKNKIPNIKEFEAFISTSTILNIDNDIWNKLIENGLKRVYWGVESADDFTLNIIDKPHDSIMLQKAKNIIEKYKIPYDIIIMSGIGLINQSNRSEAELCENDHVRETTKFVNASGCNSVFISKLEIIPKSTMAQKVGTLIFPYAQTEMEIQYRNLVKKINKPVRGSYGNQFVIERE